MVIDKVGILAAVQALSLPDGEYAVFGNGPLVVRDVCEAERIELVVSSELYHRLQDSGWSERRDDRGRSELTRDGVVARRHVNVQHYPVDTAKLIAGAERIDGLPFVDLAELRRLKSAVGHVKHVGLIDETIRAEAANRSRAEQTPRDGRTFLLRLVRNPSAAFVAARNQAYWPMAGAVALLASVLTAASAPEQRQGSMVVAAPIAAAALLGLCWCTTAVAHAICGGWGAATSPTASQATILVGLLSIPQFAGALLFGSETTLSTAVSAVLSVAGVGLTGLLYSRAFKVPVWKGAVSGVAGGLLVAVVLVFFAVLLRACSA